MVSGIATELKRAISEHRNGNLAGAEDRYKAILDIDTNHPDANHNLGVILLSQGLIEAALSRFKTALTVNPRYGQFWISYIVALLKIERFQDAEEAIKQAKDNQPDEQTSAKLEALITELARLRAPETRPPKSDLDMLLDLFNNQKTKEAEQLAKALCKKFPDHPLAWKTLGVIYADQQKLKKAVHANHKALRASPNDSEALSNQALVLNKLGSQEEALTVVEQALKLTPHFAEAHNNRGIILKELSRLEEAADSFQIAVELKPNFDEAHYHLGTVHFDLKRKSKAFDSFKAVITLRPHDIKAHTSLAVTAMQLGMEDEAEVSLRRLLEISPDKAEQHSNLGTLLAATNRTDEAESHFRAALKLDPKHVIAHQNLGVCRIQQGEFKLALKHYDDVLSLEPNNWDAQYSKSLLLLQRGELEKGWQLHESRWKKTNFTSPIRELSSPLWLGDSNLTGKTILLYWEQGFGDTIQFARYATEVKKHNCSVILEVKEPLIELMSHLDGVDNLIRYGTELPPHDYHCPLMSLPLALSTTLESIPCAPKYLRSSDQRKQKWSELIGHTSKPRLGLVWSGSETHKNDHNRSVTLEQVLTAVPDGYEVFSLQKEVRDVDIIALDQNKHIRHFGDMLSDFADTAALCDLMDIIISVDTSVAHLAGALGKPVNLLLPYVGDWRWLINREDSPWYPSLKLYRQSSDQQWKPVFENVCRALSDRETLP